MNKNFTKTLLTSLAIGAGIFANAQITTNSFTLSTSLSPGNPAACFNMADFDGDGKKDVVISNNAVTGNIYIYPGNHIVSGVIDSSTFGSKITLSTLTTPGFIELGDVNKDGKKDFVVGYWNSLNVSVFVNTSTPGNFSFTRKDLDAGGGNPFWAGLEDMDGDSLPDILSVCYATTEAYLYRNTSSGGTVSFDAPISITLGDQNASVGAFDDFNNDGKKDFAITMFINPVNKVLFFRNNSTVGNLDFILDTAMVVQTLPNRCSTGDLNNDGKSDVVVANYGEASFSLLENTSTTGGIIAFKAPVNIPTFDYPFGNAVHDLNGDGNKDLVLCSNTTGRFGVYINKGSDSLTTDMFYNRIDFTLSDNPSDPLVDDVDGDNHPDILVSVTNVVSIFHSGIVPVGVPFVNGVKETINMYPNPVQDQLILGLPAGVTKATVQLFDVSGKSFGSYSYVNGQKLDVSSLAKGIYILRVQSETQTYSGKIVKE